MKKKTKIVHLRPGDNLVIHNDLGDKILVVQPRFYGYTMSLESTRVELDAITLRVIK